MHEPLTGLGSKFNVELHVSHAVPLVHNWHPNKELEQSLHELVSKYLVAMHLHLPSVIVSSNPVVLSQLVHTFSLSQFKHPGVVHRTHCC